MMAVAGRATALAAAAAAAMATTATAMVMSATATTTVARATAAVAAASATEQASIGAAAEHGKANDREENRNTENNKSIHSEILQKNLTGTVSVKTLMPSNFRPRRVTTGRARNDQTTLRAFAPQHPDEIPVVNLCGLRRM
jgi:hypothetical protein